MVEITAVCGKTVQLTVRHGKHPLTCSVFCLVESVYIRSDSIR